MGLLNRRTRTALVALLAAQRLAELRRSARNRARSGQGVAASPGTYPLMVATHAALFVTAGWPRRHRRVPAAVEAVALAGLAAAVGLRLSVIHELGQSWNVTAHVSPSTEVITSGPYRWMRHPNYTAVALEFACLPVAVGAFGEAAWLSLADALVLWPRIRAEEALLDRLPGYREAFAGVPRFVPRPGRRSQNPARLAQSRGVSLPKPQ
ncbi:MAG TPA: isoprenylcysteine carboxylmethyltransferase family protein [Candidatus Dormibacteraeota bacterium]|nr:isoprenylcysteine carboxylmethyltransferase family protein [Candidatus Dormibacteraeota bacterium]